jgi:hypothetical protein
MTLELISNLALDNELAARAAAGPLAVPPVPVPMKLELISNLT